MPVGANNLLPCPRKQKLGPARSYNGESAFAIVRIGDERLGVFSLNAGCWVPPARSARPSSKTTIFDGFSVNFAVLGAIAPDGIDVGQRVVVLQPTGLVSR